MPTAKQIDPSGTMSIQNAFARDILRRLNKLAKEVRKLVDTEDAFGLRTPTGQLTINTRFRFLTDPQKMKAFEEWLRAQIEAGVLTEDPLQPGVPTGTKYIRSSYKQAVTNTYKASKKIRFQPGENTFFDGSLNEFLTQAFDAPEAQSKIELIATRSYSALKGITQEMETKMSRILAQGIADGRNPRVLAREMAKQITDISKPRALRIARTEVIHAHAEGQLDSFERLNVEEVTVLAEWLTAGDDRVCELCAELEGVVMKVVEARGLLPRHPNCRCTWVPADVGEDQKNQKRSKTEIDRAIGKSISAERPKQSATTARKKTTWPGADTTISKNR
jgi:SPP1 gp7 family putative phage head morphogenesis protein